MKKPQDLMSWLGDNPDPGGAGIDAELGTDSTWILHAIFKAQAGGRRPDSGRRALRRLVGRRSARRLAEAGAFVSTQTYMTRPDPGSERVLWRSLLSTDIGAEGYPPCWRWFDDRPWTAAMPHPAEGSLDHVSFAALRAVLAQWDSEGEAALCVAYYSPLQTGEYGDVPFVVETTLGEIGRLVDPEQRRHGTPANWWDGLHRWFVYTDYDLWGTRVSGPTELIQRIRDCSDLETIEHSKQLSS